MERKIKVGILECTITDEGNVTTVRLIDPVNHIVATGTGGNVHEAQQNALETTTSDEAKLWLQRIVLPEV